MEKGLNVPMQELIGRLCGKHHQELKDHFSFELGRRDENGHPHLIDEEAKRSPLVWYLLDLEHHLKDLEDDRIFELLDNDDLLGQIKEMEKK